MEMRTDKYKGERMQKGAVGLGLATSERHSKGCQLKRAWSGFRECQICTLSGPQLKKEDLSIQGYQATTLIPTHSAVDVHRMITLTPLLCSTTESCWWPQACSWLERRAEKRCTSYYTLKGPPSCSFLVAFRLVAVDACCCKSGGLQAGWAAPRKGGKPHMNLQFTEHREKGLMLSFLSTSADSICVWGRVKSPQNSPAGVGERRWH